MKILTLLLIIISSRSFAQSALDELKECELDTIDGKNVIQIVEKPPEYAGGLSNFYSVFAKYVKMPHQDSVELKSKLYISFVIDTLGNLQNFCATDIMKDAINDDVINKINNWEPGAQRGEKVPVRMQLPIMIHYK